MKDVGRVELGAESYSARLRFAGDDAAGVGLQLLPSANASRHSRAPWPSSTASRELSARAQWQLAFDNVQVVRNRSARC